MSMFADDDPRHGTYAGSQQHYKRGIPTCEPCREAYAAYMRNRRARDPKAADSMRMQSRARSSALHRLGAMYVDEYRRLYAQELGRLRSEAS